MSVNGSSLASVLPILRCPTCRSAFTQRGPGALACDRGHGFPVIDGIPRFTPESSYADSFGYQWTTFRKTQLDDADRAESAETFATKTGLLPEDLAGRSVLDVGCGMGRFADVAARWGAGSVVGMDLSRAVEAAAENLAGYPHTSVVQGDAMAPPFASGSFDVVFSIGVLHHTPNTARAVASVARVVKPGGILAIWVYARRLRVTHLGSEIMRPVTTRIPEERLLKIVQRVVPAVDRVRERFPRASRPLGVAVPTSAHADPEWRVLDTFDWYSPRYQWKHSEDEVTDWFDRMGYTDLWAGPVPVSVRGRRPLEP